MKNSSGQIAELKPQGNTTSTALGPMRVTTLADQCYQQLREAIVTLELLPDTPLSEFRLAESFGISKSPVREALARLAGEGFVTMRAGRKPHVADLNSKTISEFYRVRLLLEPSSLREVAPNLTGMDFEHLSKLVDALEESVDREDRPEYVAASEGFHLHLIERAGNQYLYRIVRHLFDQAARVRTAIYLAERRAAQHELSYRGITNHKAILDALINKDSDRAAGLLTEDIRMFLVAATSSEMQEAFEQLGNSRSWRPPLSGSSSRKTHVPQGDLK